MKRLALLVLVFSGEAMAHPGHGALASHLHLSPEFLLLAVLVGALALIRIR
jgi:hypothetical protein